jgi:hypothetical protein
MPRQMALACGMQPSRADWCIGRLATTAVYRADLGTVKMSQNFHVQTGFTETR